MTDPKTCVICDGTVGECEHTKRAPTAEEMVKLQAFLQRYMSKPLLPLFMEAFGEKPWVKFGPEPTVPMPDASYPRCGNKTLKKTPTLLMPYSSSVACTSEGCSYHAGIKNWIAESMFPIQKLPDGAKLVYFFDEDAQVKEPEESEP